MAKWRVVVAVPVIYEIEYATDITTAMGGAKNILKNIAPVVEGDLKCGPKILSLVGPDEDVEKWGKHQRELRDIRLAAAGPPTNPPIGGGDGPRAA